MAMRRKSRAIERLQRALEEIPSLQANSGRTGSAEFEKWHRDTEIAISYTFGEGSRHVKDFESIRYMPIVMVSGVPTDYRGPYLQGLRSASSVLASMIDEIGEYWENDGRQTSDRGDDDRFRAVTNDVFVVHGAADGPKQAVARVLEQLELSPIILHEQPNQGRTIIEKFEDYSQVGFAVVLLTPDDVGGPANNSNAQRPRARQNVIFELGFFIGRLGRERTCALLVDDVETPSDYDGVVYIPMDEHGGWRMALVSELQEAGFDVDANRLTERR